MIPRIMLTAAASGSGKTLITCGILKALQNRGTNVVAFKCGPDYIDPMFHERVLGTKSRNLDTFFVDDETVRHLFLENACESDIAVIEGVMGYYDGLAGTSLEASAYSVAKATKTPVIFVVNCKGMSMSIIPYIKGFLEYQKDSNIKGVILNRISPMLYERIKQQIEAELPIKVCGYVPEVANCVLESRHLGLVMPAEIADIQEKLAQFAKGLEATLDFAIINDLAGAAPELTSKYQKPVAVFSNKERVKIGVAKDAAFCFFYEDNLQLLKDMGAELIEFSPLTDQTLPKDIRGLLLSGGYPELYAKELSTNVKMRESIKAALENGLVCMAECGGFMYLHNSMEDMHGNEFPMVGVVDGKVYRTDKLGRFGYITLEQNMVFGEAVGEIPAHEFHYFDSTNSGTGSVAYKPLSNRKWECMHNSRTMLVGFPHLYYHGNIKVVKNFLQRCKEIER